MKILFLDQFGSLGGGQQILLELVKAVQKLKWSVSVIIPDGRCSEKLKEINAELLNYKECVLSDGKKNIFDIIKLLVFTLSLLFSYRKNFSSANMLCANGGRVYLLCFFASIIFSKPATYYVHIDLGGFETKLLRCFLLSKHTKAIIVPSKFILKSLQAKADGLKDHRVQVLENGLDERFKDIQYVDRFSGNSLKHIGIVGRIYYLKAQDVLIDLAKKYPDMQFHIFGEASSDEQAYYNELTKNATENIIFHGWVENLPEKLLEVPLQVCLVPSRCLEAFSLVTVQMTALSCLVVVRDLGALSDAAQDLGLFSFTEDMELESIIEQISLSSTQTLNQRIFTSYQKVVKDYSYSAFQDRLKNFFSQLKNNNLIS